MKKTLTMTSLVALSAIALGLLYFLEDADSNKTTSKKEVIINSAETSSRQQPKSNTFSSSSTKNKIVSNEVDLEEVKENSKDQVKIDKSSLLAIFEDEEDKRVRELYELGSYDPVYDQTWQEDMYYEAYTELAHSELSEIGMIDDYKCGESSCALQLSINSDEKNYMGHVSDYMRSLRDSPSILQSGKKRNIFIDLIDPSSDRPIIKISIKNTK